ncbi:hypothetical protein [Enterocloster bolteae]|uniref:hypothetical protein n=1 Tax=Enterocloster bolteae TaxID=208479 RepID=UPI0021089493|nr:hypothetical protein [Enterocloster bolteae]MCQ5145148.1 hypothetical protein [Enterocloster bolteae]
MEGTAGQVTADNSPDTEAPIEAATESVTEAMEDTSGEADNGLDTEADISEEDKELITEFGEIISEAIVDALKEVYGDEKADELCTAIAQEARDSEQPIQDIIGEKVAELAGVDLNEAQVDTPDRDFEPPAEPEKSRYELLKERYDADKDKYLFRNTFVVLERLELNIEAYRTGEDGDKGRPVSGGDIAMNIIELTRSNVWESMMEIAVRTYFDERFPAKVDTGTTVEEKPDVEAEPPKVDRPDLVRDMSGAVRDDGLVYERNVDLKELGIDTKNPLAGHYMGVDMTQAPDPKMSDISMDVWKTGRGTTDTVTIGGEATTLRIPDIRMVEFNDDRYLVDPFGKVVYSDADPTEKEPTSYFRSLDISTYRYNTPMVEAAAQGKGITVEEYKDLISEKVKADFTERTLAGFDKHAAYLKDQIPDIKGTIEAYTEKIETLSAKESELKTGIERISSLPAESISPKDVSTKEEYEKKLGDISEAKEKLSSAVEKMEARADKLESTIEGYSQAKAVCSSGATDVDSSFAVVLRADMEAGGRTGNEDYGLSKEDLEKISDVLSSLDSKVDVENETDDVEKGPKDTGTDTSADVETPEGADDKATSDTPDASQEIEAQETPDTQEADVAVEDTRDMDAEPSPASIEADGTDQEQYYPYIDIEDYKDEILGPGEDYIPGDMAAYRPSPYDGPVPVTEDEWKTAQLEHFRDCVYGLQAEGYYQKVNLTDEIKDLGYEEFDLQPEWLYENLGNDVADVLADYNEMKDTIASIDQRLEVTDAFIAVLDSPDFTADEKLAAFENMAGKMGFTEEMLETVYIDRPEGNPDVDTQMDSTSVVPEPDAAPMETIYTADGTVLDDRDAVVSPDARPDDDDALIVASEEESIGYEDIKDALDRFIDQGADGTFSLKEDFLDKYAGEIPEQDFYSAFADKVKEIEDEAKDEDKEVDANVIERLSDAFSDIEDAAISSMTYQAEHLMELVETICEGDWDSVGNMLMDSYFDKIEAQLSPIEHVADYLNDKFDPEWQADSEAIKESICERLEGISSDTFVDRVCDIAETLSDIFHGFDITLAQIGESYMNNDVDRFETEPQDVEIPEADNTADQHISDTVPDIKADMDMEADDFDMDMELSSQVESLRDFFADVDSITAGAESATTAEELEAVIAAV